MSKHKTTALLATALLTVTACSSSTDTAAPDSLATSITVPEDYAAQYLEIVRALEITRCSLWTIFLTVDSTDELRAIPELLGTAKAWDGFALEALAAATAASWPQELQGLADNVKRALAHEAATARQIVLGYTSDSSLLAGMQGIAELWREHIGAHFAMRDGLSLGQVWPCSTL